MQESKAKRIEGLAYLAIIFGGATVGACAAIEWLSAHGIITPGGLLGW